MTEIRVSTLPMHPSGASHVSIQPPLTHDYGAHVFLALALRGEDAPPGLYLTRAQCLEIATCLMERAMQT